LPKNTHIVVHLLPTSEMPPDADVTFYATERGDTERTDIYCSEASPQRARECVFELITGLRRRHLAL
jgi:hypothetical protein